MNTLDLIIHSGIVGKLVLLLLLIASILSWTIVFEKNKLFKHTSAQNEKFITSFWNSKSIDDVFLQSDQFPGSTVANVFKQGYRELKKLSGEQNPSIVLDNVGRALARATTQENVSLEKNISWLATTASASPFIGLFGTVWGIMDSFQGIGATGSANLAVVAPGISEALIATAAGIFVAVPAVIAYNHFGNQIKKSAIEMETFSQDFLNLIQRNFSSTKSWS
jgi:biopolymer transport protein TolQ